MERLARYMLVDVSNVVKGAILHGKDEEYGRKIKNEDGKEVLINSAAYGLDKAIDFLVEKLQRFGMSPKDMILVVEGPNSKLLRTSISDTYKANRGGKLPKEQYDEIYKCIPQLVENLRAVGARSVTQSGLEADDIIAYLAGRLPSCVIVSTDGDMQALVSERAHHFSSMHGLDTQRYLGGVFPHRYTTLYKALVGDASDNIKGAKGFGEKAFMDFYCKWQDEGCDEMTRMIEQRCLEELSENVSELKSLQRIVDDRENVYTCWALARMYPEKVNTWRMPLEWKGGYVREMMDSDHPALKPYYARRKIVHAGNLESTLAWMAREIKSAEYACLDIETSSSEESDEWQARKTKKDVDSDDLGVDMFGHELTSCAITFGANDEFSLYFTVDHAVKMSGFKNVTKADLARAIKLIPRGMPIVVHNSYFELTVLEREIGEYMRDNGEHGFLPNIHCTRLIATYVDENDDQRLKKLSKKHLDHTQVTFEEVTQGRKMNELTAMEAFDYGTDDTRCTAGLFNHFRCLLEIEGTWEVYTEVEQGASYLTAHAFNTGTPISIEKLKELERLDDEAYDKAWAVLRDYLIANGWPGTVCPKATTAEDVTAAFIKEVYEIVVGQPLTGPNGKATTVRTPAKLVAMIADQGLALLAAALDKALTGDVTTVNELVKAHFKGEPEFNIDSWVQIRKIMYEMMGLPIRLRKPLTDDQRAKGQQEGNPRTDDLAMQWAAQNDVKPGAPAYDALKALQAMKIAHTRQKMFYTPYLAFQHWKDNLIHASVTQNGAATRRPTSSGPNLYQLPKHPKATGEPARFREVYVPHKRDAVIVSLDFSGQELRLIADYSQDPNMLACYVGNDLKDMHALTATGILKKKALAGRVDQLWTMAGNTGAPEIEEGIAFKALVDGWKSIEYAGFVALSEGPWARLYKTLRALGKKTNFTTEYGAQAPKLAETLLIDEDEAQQYIDAKYGTFSRAEAWKQEAIEEFNKTGIATTMMGAIRHLSEALRSGNKWEIRKAERQAVNFKIQGSGAEMMKLAMSRVWKQDLCFKYDARFIASIYDELVFSVGIADLVPFLRELHAAMTAPYSTMKVPIVSSISIGPNFGQQIELGETVNAEAVNDALYYGIEGEKLTPLFPELAPMKAAA